MPRRAIDHNLELQQVLAGDGDRLWQEFLFVAMDSLKSEMVRIEQRLQSPDNIFTLEETGWADHKATLEKTRAAFQKNEALLKGRALFWVGLNASSEENASSCRSRISSEAALRDWLSESVSRLENEARSIMAALKRALAALEERATFRRLTARGDLLQVLGPLRTVAAFARAEAKTSALVLRDLIGELSSPAIMAAGGGCSLFVIRC